MLTHSHIMTSSICTTISSS